MPGRRHVTPVDATLCRRCQTNNPTITVRNEPICQSCFCRYVSTKVVKRMETFRVRHTEPGKERCLLLPMSLGAGSIALLHVLSRHLQGQLDKTGRTGFTLRVLHIREDTRPGSQSEVGGAWQSLQARYPGHVYSTVPLADVFSFDGWPALIDPKTLFNEQEDLSNADKLDRLLDSLDSATSRTDMQRILKRKLIVSSAEHRHCEAILWADSATTLAEQTLAETAKGRGFSLPWIVSDGASPFGVPFYHPMKDLLSKEIAAFAKLLDPPLDEMILSGQVKQVVSLKNTTIDDLLKQYFASVEHEFPSIVANVVKTTGKLRAPSLREVERECELCSLPLDGQAPEKSRLCYGCIRTLPQEAG